jgi:hypothetical protein
MGRQSGMAMPFYRADRAHAAHPQRQVLLALLCIKIKNDSCLCLLDKR